MLRGIRIAPLAVVVACADRATIGSVEEPPAFVLQEEWSYTPTDSVPQSLLVSSVAFAALLPNGEIVYSDPDDHVLKVISAEGKFLRTIGRAGEGPGEFDSPMSSGIIGDTLWVFDWTQTGNLELFDLEFKHIGTLGVYEGGGYGMVSGKQTISPRSIDRTAERPAMFNLFDRNGAVVKPIVVDTTPRTSTHRFSVGGRDSAESPIVAGWSAAVLPGGSKMIVLVPGDLFTKEPGKVRRYEISFPDGTVSPPTTLQLPARPLLPADRDSIINAAVARVADNNWRDKFRAGVRLPDYYPPLNRMWMGRDSTLWLSGFHTDTTFLVLTHEGKPVARVHARPAIRLMIASMKGVWARIPDEHDVPTLVKYRLVPLPR